MDRLTDAIESDSPARVLVRVADGAFVTLAPGDVIGRGRSCRLHIDDPRISEAHALVSLRGDALWLLGLRGRMQVGDAVVDRIRLDDTLRITLAPGVELEVIDVLVPDVVMAIELAGGVPQLLNGTTSVFVQPQPSLRGGWFPNADAWIWSTDETWRLRRSVDSALVLLEDGVPVQVSGIAITPRVAAVDEAGVTHTVQNSEPVRIDARFYTVHITRLSGGEPLVLTGTAARVVSELVALKGPVEWSLPAREIWGQDTPDVVLRSRWDTTVSRLRRRLRCANLRPDLIRASRSGVVELVIGPDDVVVDQI
ncbi:MAG: hypothetical protein IV100_34880 [Myxococcales bacterium]|nr:hypothetical protein [Myxococcales bacterium]